MNPTTDAFWSKDAADLLRDLNTSPQGLASADAVQRLARTGANQLKPLSRSGAWALLLAQFTSPIILILLAATLLSFFLHDPINAVIILVIVLISGLLGFWQERSASNAVAKLLALVQIKAAVLRDGQTVEIPVEQIVPGDVVVLNAGDVAPGDCLILESKDLFADESTLTGETFPVEKAAAVLPPETALAQRSNALWMGSHVVSGAANAVVVHTGAATEFGKVSERLKLRPAETEFERGIRSFGYFLMEVTLVLVVAIFAINVYLSRPVIDSLLFSLALAVGLTPQLLPAIISINLAHGARRMAESKVIVKRLAAIEDFGSMNVICSDKTGTLTEGTVTLNSAVDLDGNDSEQVLLYAYLNASYESGFTNPIDEAIRAYKPLDLSGYSKQDEIPYDFIRKRLSIVVSHNGDHLLLTKGALDNVLAACSNAATAGGTVPIAAAREKIQRRYAEYSGQGLRTLGVAYKRLGAESRIDKSSEADMTFAGFLLLFDPPKPNVATTVAGLRDLGVALKVITGDNRLVAASIGGQMGLSAAKVITGPDLSHMGDDALMRQAPEVDVFAEIEPNQKERIILALRKAGNVVGYMGDGINDASALHAADVGISVDSAVDVAKDAADIVLLERNLDVLLQGVAEGRTTFANTLKYVFMATSANFGNMFSMAGVSLFLSFLPLLPKQILLTNLLTDFPEMTIATDRVDAEMIDHPRRWDIAAIRKFMVTFGLLSSCFDYVTFGVLLWILQAGPEQFRTGWYMESVVSACLIVLVIRTRRPFYRSAPGRNLLLATLAIVGVTLVLPYTPVAALLGFVPLPLPFLALLACIVVLYVAGAEVAKRIFYRNVKL